MPWSALQSISLRFNNHDFGSWVATTNCCISRSTEHSACSAWSLTCAELEPAFYPLLPLACLLLLILSFLVTSFIFSRFFVLLPFCLSVLRFLLYFVAIVCDCILFPFFLCFSGFYGLVSLFSSLFSCGHVRTVDFLWQFLTASIRSLLVVWCLHGVKGLTSSWKHHCNKDSPQGSEVWCIVMPHPPNASSWACLPNKNWLHTSSNVKTCKKDAYIPNSSQFQKTQACNAKGCRGFSRRIAATLHAKS